MMHPKIIQIGVSYACNIRCLSCLQGAKPDGALMPWETFERILPLIRSGCEVLLFGRGEPLMHPRFIEMAAAATERGGIVSTVTNGTGLTSKTIAALVGAGCEHISISIHGADRETHERLQAGVDSDAVWQSVAECRTAGIEVILATVVMKSTMDQLLPIAKRGEGLGVGAVTWLRIIHDGSLEAEDPFTPECAMASWATIEDLRGQLPQGMVYHDNLGLR